MIVLDTNVVSELIRPEPHPAVLAWAATQPSAAMFTTEITRAEMLYGVAVLPAGRRRDGIAAAVTAVFEEFAGRILPFRGAASEHYARIVAGRRAVGQPIDGLDAMIAATTAAAGFRIATRDVSAFQGCGLEVIDPWRVCS